VSGGPPGYIDFVQAIADPKHPERDEMVTWYGGAFYPHTINVIELNISIRRIKL